MKALNQLKRYLAALERNYLTAREEHHNLQLQNYKDKSINIGEFDPERLEVLSSTSVYLKYWVSYNHYLIYPLEFFWSEKIILMWYVVNQKWFGQNSS